VISRALADDLVEDNYLPDDSQRLQVLPDGVDLRRYQDLPAPRESREILSAEFQKQNLENGSIFSPVKFTVGYTGHLYPGRGVSLMMDIAARMPEINFLIVGGEKSDVSKLKNEATDRRLENVTLTGFIPNAALPKYQAACDVLLMPYQSQVSASSGGDIGRYLSPMKLFEYLACGRAICSSDLPVLREILSPETAVILPPDKVDSWIEAIQMLSENPILRNEMGDNARTAAQNYSWEARAESIFMGAKKTGIEQG
jgi:glycosyltransferase involved in cell wall biosynthesis